MPRQVVTRFAPSPTGMLHIGGVRTALFCWLYAKRHGGRFILRIEDTDLERNTDDNIRIIEDGMSWCGLDWDEGPIPGRPKEWKGPNGPYRQMQRMESHYRPALEKLLEMGLAYRCRCTKESLEERRKKAETGGIPFQYNRGADAGNGCRDKNYDASQPFSVRLKMPSGNEPWLENGCIVLRDKIKGRIDFPAQSLDDWVMARTGEGGQAGVPTYNFCVVIDDIGMEVTHVIRGDDHVANTPKQIALYQALGNEPPTFAHVPMILGADGAKLSKRHGATSITEYQALGLLPSAIRLALAKLSWCPKIDGKASESAEEEILTDEQMIELFDLDEVQKSPARFDMDKLNWINQKLIQRSSWQELEPLLRPFLPSAWESKPEEWKQAAIHAMQKGKSLVEMANSMAFCWAAPQEFKSAEEHITPKTLPALAEVATLQDYRHDPLKAAFDEILARHGLKIKDLAQALRVALCGKPISPGIFDTLYLLGPEEVRERLKRWLE